MIASGYLPFDPLVGYKENGRLRVREGNRRIATLKLDQDLYLARPISGKDEPRIGLTRASGSATVDRGTGRITSAGLGSAMTVRDTLSRIEKRLGFVPPFFAPASEHPEVLENLWSQTESAYLDNALPNLFKEKLAALLGRYCEVPYCLVCHACTLRPLGMSGIAIVELMSQRHPSDEQVREVFERWDACAGAIDVAAMSESAERDLFCLACTVYAAAALASAARQRLRQRLSPQDYRNLIVFISYSKMCHEWMSAHPEVSFELDQRYIQNYDALASEAPSLAGLFAERSGGQGDDGPDRIEAIVSERAAEAPRSVAITERRLVDVIGAMKERIAVAVNSVGEKEQVAQELRRTADFAQELLAIVSHDLRNPLSSVMMGAQLVLQLEPGNAKIPTTVRRILSSARRAERLIYDLLDFSQSRAGGGIPIHLRPADLQTVVRGATDDLELVHPGRTFRIAHDGDGFGEWDADRLAQVLSNLLANAVVHGRKDTPIELSTRGDAESVSISIHNANREGPIPEELVPVLFDPFKRGVVRAISSTRSVGLGLYIVNELARGHRGRVDVSSNASGTTFTVHLPRYGSCPATARETA